MSLADLSVTTGMLASANDSSVAYDLVLLAHVLSALAGMVAVVTAGGFAFALRGALLRGGPLPEALARYYRPGVNWVGRMLFAVPVFGVALVAMSGGEWNWSDGWVLLGLAIWAVVAVVAEAVLWPGERTLQSVVADRAGALPEPTRATADESRPVGADAARCLQAGLVGIGLGAALVAVGFLMVVKP